MTQPQASRGVRLGLYALTAVFVLLHNDFWQWNDSRFVLGLPVGFTYHLFYCAGAIGLMALLVRWAWPTDLAGEGDA